MCYWEWVFESFEWIERVIRFTESCEWMREYEFLFIYFIEVVFVCFPPSLFFIHFIVFPFIEFFHCQIIWLKFLYFPQLCFHIHISYSSHLVLFCHFSLCIWVVILIIIVIHFSMDYVDLESGSVEMGAIISHDLLSVCVFSCCFHKILYLMFLLWHKDQVLFYMFFIVFANGSNTNVFQ